MWLLCAAIWTACLLTVNCLSHRSLAASPEDYRTDGPSFDVELFQTVASQTDGNVALSPVSVAAVLSLLYEGAGGITARQIRDALRLSENQLNQSQNVTPPRHRADVGPSTYVRSGTSVFVDGNLEVNRDFEYKARQHLSTLKSIPFRDPAKAAEAINKWALDVTNGKVSEIVTQDSLSVDILMLLANVIYFEGVWEKEFYKNFTMEWPFYINGYKQQLVSTMVQHNAFPAGFIRPLNSYAVQLPYSGGRYSMLLLVPNSRDGIGRLLRDLPYYSLHKIIASLEEQDVDLRLPRFKMDFEASLVSALQMMGITSLFTNAADLTGISNMGIKVSDTIHRASIDVNEEGTIAYASTVSMIVPLIGPLNLVVNADHPFLFFIHDNNNNQFIFMGRVSDPTTGIKPEITEKEPATPTNVAEEVATPLPPSTKPTPSTPSTVSIPVKQSASTAVQENTPSPAPTQALPQSFFSTPALPTPAPTESPSTPGLSTPLPIASSFLRKNGLKGREKNVS